eukprot:TRINITY_DN1783_c0_g1_i3.p1 TRINITY_DN1783_c0_g1~~TRINITY_DN1783_c0_g1_i3.p1  ORF type:complete len:218 (-),score=29.76 TRINITY_DN1783_c0_g1_i3:526-1179(-)
MNFKNILPISALRNIRNRTLNLISKIYFHMFFQVLYPLLLCKKIRFCFAGTNTNLYTIQSASPCKNSNVMTEITPIPQFSEDLIGFICYTLTEKDVPRNELTKYIGPNIIVKWMVDFLKDTGTLQKLQEKIEIYNTYIDRKFIMKDNLIDSYYQLLTRVIEFGGTVEEMYDSLWYKYEKGTEGYQYIYDIFSTSNDLGVLRFFKKSRSFYIKTPYFL